jgi:hypothetical protein
MNAEKTSGKYTYPQYRHDKAYTKKHGIYLSALVSSVIQWRVILINQWTARLISTLVRIVIVFYMYALFVSLKCTLIGTL